MQPFQGIVNGTSQNWQPFQGRRISRMPKRHQKQQYWGMEKLWEIYHVYTHKSNVDKERHDIFWFVQARDIRNRPFNGVNDDEPKKIGYLLSGKQTHWDRNAQIANILVFS